MDSGTARSLPPSPVLLDRVAGVQDLPMLSEHHQRLRQVVADDNARIEEVIGLIERDPAFAANLIRIANSPMFAQRMPVDTIRRAVQVIGFNGVGDMSLTIEVVKGFGFPAGLDVQMFWDHSVTVAMLAKQIAGKNGASRDAAYLIGLLHDVGLLALASFVPDVFQALMSAVRDSEEEGASILTIAREQHGCTHVDVSAKLMEMWNFPADTLEAMHAFTSMDEAQEAFNPDRAPQHLALSVYNAHQIAQSYEGSFAWDCLPDLPDDYGLTQSRDFEFVSGISAAVLSCCK